MKRLIRANQLHIPKLRLIVELTDSNDAEIVAATNDDVLHHPSVKREYKKSDGWLNIVNDFIKSIIGSMQGRKFKIIKKGASKKSYTYYILFQPADQNGNLWDQELELQIELRDHRSKTHGEGAISPKLLVKTYYIGEDAFDSTLSIMKHLWSVMDDLSLGDFSSFVE